MPFRFDFIIQKLKLGATGPKLTVVGGKAVPPGKFPPAAAPVTPEAIQIEPKRRKTA